MKITRRSDFPNNHAPIMLSHSRSRGNINRLAIIKSSPGVWQRMRLHHRLWLLCSIIFILSATSVAVCQAQYYHTETIEVSDGLPSPDVKSITQDRYGLIWIATRSGLAFYNGRSWHSVSVDSLALDCSQALLQVDHKGEIWALMSGFGPALIHKDFCQWDAVGLPIELSQKTHAFTGFALAEADSHVVPAIVEQSKKLFIQYKTKWHQVPLSEYGITRISNTIVHNNKFILATDKGVFSVEPGAPFIIQPLVNQKLTGPVLCLSIDPNNNSLWIVGSDWLGKITRGVFTILVPSQDSTFACFQESHSPTSGADAFGGIYLSGHYGTQYFNPQTGMEFLGPENGLIDNDSRGFFLDKENVLWQGTRRGITKIISRHTTGYTSLQGLLSDEVTAIVRRADGTLILGHNDGLTLWNETMKTIPFKKSDVHNRVLDLAEDSEGNVWIAGRQRGLGRLSPKGDLTWWRTPEPTLGYYVSVVVDSQDQVWVALGNKLMLFKDEEFLPVLQSGNPLESTHIRRLILGYDDSIFLATGNRGLFSYNNGQITHWDTGLKDNGNSIFDVLETHEGVTWVGTRSGLYKLANNRLIRPAEKQYDIQRPVYFLEIDQQNRLWVGTDNGLIRINEDEVEFFTVENGLIGRETNRCASLIETDGKFWVGTERGLTVLDDNFQNSLNPAPMVYLIQLESENKVFSLLNNRNSISLPIQDKSLIFTYCVLTSRESERIKIQSRLEGLESEWIEQPPSGDFTLRYNNLDSGSYKLHLRGTAFGQPWSETIHSIEIVVESPFWHHAWFLILCGLILLVALVFPVIALTQRRYTTRLQHEVDVQVAANLQIETELEQARNLRSLGILAGGIAHDFNNLLTIIFGNLSLVEGSEDLNPQHKAQLKTATNAIERARDLTNQLLTFSRGGAPVLESASLADLVRESATFVLHGSSTKCHFNLPENLWPVEMDSGQMSQVINNLLMNAQEAMTSCGSISISGNNLATKQEDLPAGSYVQIEISDNGPGIEPAVLAQIFNPYFTTKENGSGLGLATARSILNRHHGKLTAESNLGHGTTLRLIIPASNRPIKNIEEEALSISTVLSGRVLVMDDELEVRASFRLMLESLGLEVEEAENGGQALHQYRKRQREGSPYVAVLMDLTIPGGLGGKDIIGPLLESDPDAKVIVVSGYSHDKAISQHLEFGFKAALAKPVDVRNLSRVLHRVLED